MPISYTELKSPTALRTSQLSGTNQATLETAWSAFTVDGSEIPESDLKNTILATEKEIAEVIANNPANPYRSFLYARTAALADLASTPTVDSDGNEIIGVWDAVADVTTGRPCTYQPTQTISDIVDGASDFFSPTNYFYYNTNGNFIRTTQASVFLQGCSWDMTVQSAAYDVDGDSPLPQTLTNLWIAGVLANSAQVGWTDGAGAIPYYAGLYASGLAALKEGTAKEIPLDAANVVTN